MSECETVVVFRILGVLAKARALEHPLALDEIADAARLPRPNTERFMTVLESAGAVRAETTSNLPPRYSVTRYGLERLVGGSASQTQRPQ
jgi:DNA-binding IclR family transcriptional regulator